MDGSRIPFTIRNVECVHHMSSGGCPSLILLSNGQVTGDHHYSENVQCVLYMSESTVVIPIK